MGWAEEKRRLPQSVRPMRRRRGPGPAPRGANGRRQSRPSRGREQGCAKRRPPPSWPSSGDVFAVVRWRAAVGPCCATSVRVETGGARLCLPRPLSRGPPQGPPPRGGRTGGRAPRSVGVGPVGARAPGQPRAGRSHGLLCDSGGRHLPDSSRRRGPAAAFRGADFLESWAWRTSQSPRPVSHFLPLLPHTPRPA